METDSSAAIATSRYVLTGMSGTGKTVLLDALAEAGETCFSEVPRRLLRDQLASDGPALPSKDPDAFIAEMLRLSIDDFLSADGDQRAFYDRGLPDVVAYAKRFGVDPAPAIAASSDYRYDEPIFLAPPWAEIFEQDEFRRASFDEYLAFHDSIVSSWAEAGYTLMELPRTSIPERLGFIRTVVGAA